MIDFDAPPRRGHYLLIPVMPTPNGRLHLGHAAGPYLRMDILARHLRRRGDRVRVVFGSDPYDSYVLLKAHQTGETPEQVANRFHDLMHNDLRALDIVPDAFINPLSTEWAGRYTSHHLMLMDQLAARGAIELVSEKFLYCRASDRYIVGCWLLGICPTCGNDAGSYFCEHCGAHFRPEMLREPRSRLDEGPLEWRPAQCPYIRLSDVDWIFAKMHEMGIPQEFQKIVRQHIDIQGPLIRLAQPVPWGIFWTVPDEHVPQVLFNYSLMLAYAVLCGEIYGDLEGTGVNAFAPDSGVTVIGSFGIDNALPFLLGGLSMAWEAGTIKPFDHYLVNYFYNLEGAKFSTSRGHVIWSGDIVEQTGIPSDMVRCYMAKVNPEHAVENFDIRDFVAFANDTVLGCFQASAEAAWPGVDGAGAGGPPGRLVERLRELLGQQDHVLDPHTFHLRETVGLVEDWVADRAAIGEADHAAYWWLKGLALLAYPLMPRFGAGLWQALGHQGEPTIYTFNEPAAPRAQLPPSPFRPIAIDDLRPCLPATFEAAREAGG